MLFIQGKIKLKWQQSYYDSRTALETGTHWKYPLKYIGIHSAIRGPSENLNFNLSFNILQLF